MGCRAESNTFRIERSHESNTFIARCIEFPGLDAQAATCEAALRGVMLAVEELLEWPLDDERLHAGRWD